MDTEELDIGVAASANGKASEWDDARHVSRKSWHEETREKSHSGSKCDASHLTQCLQWNCWFRGKKVYSQTNRKCTQVFMHMEHTHFIPALPPPVKYSV